MHEYEEMGHMEEVKEDREPEISYYIPHQGIHRPEKSTTKLRVVFDASAPSSNGISLNSLQINGGIVQEDLFAILCRFRKHRIALTADIKKIYRMILINPQQRDLQRILWKNNPDDPIKTYKLNTVTYGTTSAPYLATRTLKQIATDEGGKFPLAATVVETDFYVDDLVTGVNNEATAVELQRQLIKLLDAGGLKLHKWSSNSRRLLQCVPQEDLEFCFDKDKENIKTLGLKWNPKDDTFGFAVTTSVTTSKCTKRTVLSEISRLFDPLGLLGPAIVKAKIYLQRLWLLKIDWDQPLPQKEAEEWRKFSVALRSVERVKVRRCAIHYNDASFELHGFCDASKDAYGAAVYLRSISSTGEAAMNLL
ncbi:hypothetical protein AVEN_162002-1 [Araneus ventricosus]|uniref:Reverse transcriptase domain-containing protein n=1 Tax=Araneus ventricosus TaxID=182803 RepID=A0A4Y2K568_ARAVE|nr:hypothetical protein AVEN_162002-1 [Araneus ventricosus]